MDWETNNEHYLQAALTWLRTRLAWQAAKIGGETEPVSDEQMDQATADLAAAESVDPLPALPLLARRLDLSPFEQQVLLLCAALELDTRIGWLCAMAPPNARPAMRANRHIRIFEYLVIRDLRAAIPAGSTL